MLRQVRKPPVQIVVKEARFVRVNAYGRIDERVSFCQAERRSVRILRYVSIADVDYYLDARIKSAPDHLFAVAVEVVRLNMRVRVYVHGSPEKDDSINDNPQLIGR
jgi:hypothetical protein